MSKILLPFVILLLAVIVVMSLDRRLPRADVVVAQTTDCFTLDPQRMSYMQDLRLARSLYEGLVRIDGMDGSIVPAVAESWTTSEDGRLWTFRLRKDARWSNGDQVTAADFVKGWQRAILPDLAADYSSMFFVINGAAEFFRERAAATDAYALSEELSPEKAEELFAETMQRFDEMVGIRAVDDQTLEVQLKEPLAYFLDLCAFGVFSPVHPPTLDAFSRIEPSSGLFRQDHDWTRPENLVSNGPYTLIRRRFKRDIRLELNPYYWNKDAVASETVEIKIIGDPNTSILAFEAGTIDWVIDVQAEYKAEMAAQVANYLEHHDERIQSGREDGRSIDEILASLPEPAQNERRNLHPVPAFGTFFFSFNCRPNLVDGRPNPLSDARVRRALAMSIDKKRIVDLVLRTGEEVAGSLVPPDSIVGYTTPEGLSFDPEAARAELTAAGWEDRDGDGYVENESGERFPSIDLLYTLQMPRYRDMALTMRDMWGTHLGIESTLRAKDTKAYREDLSKGSFMVARGGWYGDYGDPMTFLELSQSENGNNDRKFSNAIYDALLEEAARELSPTRRLELLQEAERILIQEEMPILPMYHYSTTYMYEPTRLRGISRHPRLEQNYWSLEVITTETEGAPEDS
jgi:oligopeptide transport system substrate-binding protein